jgi:hypothetical protein
MREEITFLQKMALEVREGEHIESILTSETYDDICLSLSLCEWFIVGPSHQDEYAIIFFSGTNLYFFDTEHGCLIDFKVVDEYCGEETTDELETAKDYLATANIENFNIQSHDDLDESTLRILLGECKVKVLVPTQPDLKKRYAIIAFSRDYLFMVDPVVWDIHYLEITRMKTK